MVKSKILRSFIVFLFLSLASAQAQVVVGGSGGWGGFKEKKSIIELKVLTKKLFRTYGRHISKCSGKIKPVKIQTWQDFSLNLIKVTLKENKADSEKDKSCHQSTPEPTLKNIKSDCDLSDEEIILIKKLLEASNFKSYLKQEHKMFDEDVDSLMKLLQFLVDQTEKASHVESKS